MQVVETCSRVTKSIYDLVYQEWHGAAVRTNNQYFMVQITDTKGRFEMKCLRQQGNYLLVA